MALRDMGRKPAATMGDRLFYWHYAWVIVAVIGVVQMVGVATRQVFGVFVDPLVQTFGWGQGTITLAYAISNVVSALASPLAGWLADRYGARRSIALGGALFVAGLAASVFMTQPWHLYLSFGVLMGVAQAIFIVPTLPTAMNWFHRHLGVGIGAIMASWSLGPALMAPALGFLLDRFGWRAALWSATAATAAVLVVTLYLFRDRPQDKGLLPYGARPGEAQATRRAVDPVQGRLLVRRMRRTAAFWNMGNIHFLGCVGHAVILVYLVPLAIYRGMSLVTASSLLTVLATVSVATRVATPVLSDRFGPKPVMALFYAVQGVTVLLLFWAREPWVFYVFAVTFGIGYGGEGGGFPILTRRYYGHAPTGQAFGVQLLGAGLGMALGGWIGGVIFDLMGGYELALAISVAASLAGAVSILLLEPTDRPLVREEEAAVRAATERRGHAPGSGSDG